MTLIFIVTLARPRKSLYLKRPLSYYASLFSILYIFLLKISKTCNFSFVNVSINHFLFIIIWKYMGKCIYSHMIIQIIKNKCITMYQQWWFQSLIVQQNSWSILICLLDALQTLCLENDSTLVNFDTRDLRIFYLKILEFSWCLSIILFSLTCT